MAADDTRHQSIGWPPLAISVPTVQLRHTLPDESGHIDWLIARDPGGARPLITFRLPCQLEDLPAGVATIIERIADHRPIYLKFEGELSAGRGRVERIAAGTAIVTACHGSMAILDLAWRAPDRGGHGETRQRVQLQQVGDDTRGPRWHLRPLAATMADELTGEPPAPSR